MGIQFLKPQRGSSRPPTPPRPTPRPKRPQRREQLSIDLHLGRVALRHKHVAARMRARASPRPPSQPELTRDSLRVLAKLGHFFGVWIVVSCTFGFFVWDADSIEHRLGAESYLMALVSFYVDFVMMGACCICCALPDGPGIAR